MADRRLRDPRLSGQERMRQNDPRTTATKPGDPRSGTDPRASDPRSGTETRPIDPRLGDPRSDPRSDPRITNQRSTRSSDPRQTEGRLVFYQRRLWFCIMLLLNCEISRFFFRTISSKIFESPRVDNSQQPRCY